MRSMPSLCLRGLAPFFTEERQHCLLPKATQVSVQTKEALQAIRRWSYVEPGEHVVVDLGAETQAGVDDADLENLQALEADFLELLLTDAAVAAAQYDEGGLVDTPASPEPLQRRRSSQAFRDGLVGAKRRSSMASSPFPGQDVEPSEGLLVPVPDDQDAGAASADDANLAMVAEVPKPRLKSFKDKVAFDRAMQEQQNLHAQEEALREERRGKFIARMYGSKAKAGKRRASEKRAIVVSAGDEPSIFEFRGNGGTKNKNQVVDYLTHTSVALGGDVHRYKAIWQRDMHLQMTDTAEKDVLLNGLKHVNRGLVTQDDVDFCLMALDVVDETSKVKVERDFRMFCTIAALSERVKSLGEELDVRILKESFRDARALRFKIMRARSLFYLSDTATTSGTMSLDDFEGICLAGNVSQDVTRQVIGQLRDDGLSEVEFLDFLGYLPLFCNVHTQLLANPLEAPVLRSRAS